MGLQQVTSVVDALLISIAGLCEARATIRGGANGVRRRARRSYILLPYLAIAGTDVLLAVVVGNRDGDAPTVAGAVIVVTALVALRQVIALRDNARLLDSVRQHERRLRHQAAHDDLSGLANRSTLGRNVTAALAAEDSADSPAMLLIDLDDFKTINDTLGHAVGDEVLQVVAGRLRQAVRDGDVVARLGGDEFAVFLPDAPGEILVRLAQRIQAALATPIHTPIRYAATCLPPSSSRPRSGPD